MDATAPESRLRSRPRFDLATDADEPEIRRLLRDNPMDGAMRLAFEREPDARVAAGIEGPIAHQTIVGRRGDGSVFGFGTRSVRIAYINGRPQPLGYLGGLRLDVDQRGNAAALRQGYRLFRHLHDRDGLTPLYLTSILSDNVPARRLLEANLKGMPTYRPLGEFVTLIMRVRRSGEFVGSRIEDARKRVRAVGAKLIGGEASSADEIASVLQRQLGRYQFAPQWTAELLQTPRTAFGLAPADFVIPAIGGRLIGCAALWDQTAFKQSVVAGYSRGLALARPFVNAIARLTGRPRLPAVGEFLAIGFVSHFCTAPDVDRRVVRGMVEHLHGLADERDLNYLAVGLAADDPQLAILRDAFGGREIRSRLYVVHWPDGESAANALDGRALRPEVALL